jgi:hypothetical protein
MSKIQFKYNKIIIGLLYADHLHPVVVAEQMGVAFLLQPDHRHVLLVVESAGSEIFFILRTGCLVWCLMVMIFDNALAGSHVKNLAVHFCLLFFWCQVVTRKAFLKQESGCPTCRGQGKIVQEHCHQCQGSGTVGARREIRVNIPPRVETSVMIRVRGGDSQENLTIRVEVRHQAPSFSTLNMFRRWEKNSMF